MEVESVIKLKFKGQEFELTMDEAVELRMVLDKITGKLEPYPVVYPVVYPVYPTYPTDQPYYEQHITYSPYTA